MGSRSVRNTYIGRFDRFLTAIEINKWPLPSAEECIEAIGYSTAQDEPPAEYINHNASLCMRCSPVHKQTPCCWRCGWTWHRKHRQWCRNRTQHPVTVGRRWEIASSLPRPIFMRLRAIRCSNSSHDRETLVADSAGRKPGKSCY